MNSALRYELDEYGKIGITLETFDSLEEMDLFMQKFNNSNDVKGVYFNKINEFLKTDSAREFLNLVKDRENNGYLRGYVSDMTRSYHVPLIYKSKLLDEKDIYIRLRQSLLKKSVLYDIYYRKWHVLPKRPAMFLRDELTHCVVHNGTSRIFIKEFIAYIKKLNPIERYLVFRCLCDKCHLLDIERLKVDNLYKIRKDDNEYQLYKVNSYKVGEFTDEEINEMLMEDKISLREGVEKEFNIIDISMMLENYDIDEIDKNTNYFDKLEKKRGK